MQIIYVISMIILLTLVILLKKSKEKLEITKTITITLTLTLAYNTLCAYILNLINIPITLINLSIINAIFSICILIKIIKVKEIQKYTISKTNILIVILFIIITTVIIHINFEDLTRIRYVSMDAREHYKAAREFSENTSLSNKAKENNTVGEAFMPMGYVNAGILFKIFEPYIGKVMLYRIFILFEAFVYLLTGIMFYILIGKYVNKMNSKIIAIIFSIIYVLGYPLNAWISGFHYLIIGILFIEAIIYIVLKEDRIKISNELVIMFLLNFGLILSYALFCPFVYLAEFIYYIYRYKKNRNKIELILFLSMTLIVPGIIGVVYLIVPAFGAVGDAIALEGWLYKNLWSNFILFVPFSVYAIYKSIKNKEFTFDNTIFILLVIYMLVLFVGTKSGKCSEYYFYKNYYIMWLMLVYLNVKGMCAFKADNKFVINIYSIAYVLFLTLTVCFQKTYISQKPNDNLNTVMEIFTFNNTMMNAKNSEFVTNEELQLFTETEKIIEEKWREEDKILFVTGPTQERWIQSLTGYKNILFDNKDYAIKNLKEENYKYIVTFENRNTYQNVKKYINEENMKIVYENAIGKIYEKKEE